MVFGFRGMVIRHGGFEKNWREAICEHFRNVCSYASTAVGMGRRTMRLSVFACARSFWNFDALFQPQQHPARDAHDTFFVTSAPSFDDMSGNMWGIHTLQRQIQVGL